MASQTPDPALPREKAVMPAEVMEGDLRNGSEKVNGHASPTPATANINTEAPALPDSKAERDTNGVENVMAQVTTAALNSDKQPEAPDVISKDTNEQAAGHETEALKPSKGDDDEMEDAPPQESLVQGQQETTAPTAPESEGLSAKPDLADKPSSPGVEGDVEMGDASQSLAVPSSGEASTQDTAVVETAAVSAEDLNLQPASMSNLAIDAAPTSPAPATTADTSMSDAPQSAPKVAHARDEEEGEEPPAKRAKTDTPSDSVDVKIAPLDDAVAVNQDQTGQVSLYDANGQPKNLADPSLDGNEITRHQSSKIRTILAGLKKTKAGAQFKAPVSTMWPALWADYSAKVAEPMDITTMERRLKGVGDPEYPPYPTMGAFKSDLHLIYQNSVTFNGLTHNVTAQAKQVVDQVLERMAMQSAVETQVEEKKVPKQHPTRHTEPRVSATAQPSPAHPAPQRPPKPPPATSPVEKTGPSPAYAIPPNNHGVPLIRRDSTKNLDDRPKRPVHPPKSKDFGYDVKKKNKLPLELRFCREVLDEIMKLRHYDLNQHFLDPVDPVALAIPHYFKIIKKPMDLKTMNEKLNTGQYNNSREFEKDFQQIVKNCQIFNGEDHPVTQCALQLDEIFKREWAKKDAWMAKRAPPVSAPQPSSAASRGNQDEDSEDEAAESEEEEEQKPQDTITPHIEALTRRLKEEQDKLNELMFAKVPDLSMVEVSQTMIAVLQKQIIQEKQKLAEAPPPKKKAKPTASKPKKPSGGSKKATAQAAGSSGGGASGSKKSGGGAAKKKQRYMGALEKEVVSEAIPQLEQSSPQALEKAIDIIKKDTNQNENDSGELELDIEALSQEALVKLYDLSIKHFPNLRAEKEAELAAAAPPPVPEPAPKPKSAKPKKNKPMNKAEQEARLRQLSDLRAQLKGRGSNSQEPIESIEGDGNGPSGQQPAPYESEEEESSEEE